MNNERYPDAYNKWAGNSAGVKPDYNRCCESVRSEGRWPFFHQCTRKRGHGPDQAYCKTHDPDAVAARRKASDEAYNAKYNKWRYEFHGRHFYEVLKQIADGHNDARDLAQETLAKFDEGKR
jgi:hypothetical protein